MILNCGGSGSGLTTLAPGDSLRDVLERMRQLRPSLGIDASNRWVNLVDSKATDLLETRLKHLEIPHPKTNPIRSFSHRSSVSGFD